MPPGTLVHVGTYASSGGAGLVPLTIPPEGAPVAGEAYDAAANASFAAYSPGRGLYYMVDEESGAIGVHRREENRWRELASLPSGGEAPCYVALDAGERRLAVANYESGHSALFQLDAHGLPQTPPALFRRPGSGPVAERQEGPHAHCVRFSPDGRALYCVDLGADRVLRIALDAQGFGEAHLAYPAPAGSGPRHLLFHPERPLALLLSELASTLTLLEIEADGGLMPVQTVSTLPSDFCGESLGGHLELGRGGSRVYASNRGHDSIAVFALDTAPDRDARLEPLQHVSSGGAHPRHFGLLERAAESGERLLVVAHEQDGRIGVFALREDGTLVSTGQAARVPGACCVLP